MLIKNLIFELLLKKKFFEKLEKYKSVLICVMVLGLPSKAYCQIAKIPPSLFIASCWAIWSFKYLAHVKKILILFILAKI